MPSRVDSALTRPRGVEQCGAIVIGSLGPAWEERALLGWLLLLAGLLVCVWAGITVLIAWTTGRWPRQL